MRSVKFVNNLLSIKVVRYLFSGGAAFAAEYGTFLVLFYAVGSQPVIANTVSFLIGLAISFSLNKVWVFGGHHSKKAIHQFILYCCLAAINLAITSIAIHFLVEAGMEGYAAKLLLIIAIAVWNFAIFRAIIFRSKDN